MGPRRMNPLGSLIVNLPDGRNEPLTVGYHKVNVEIPRPDRALTIEESFVNHTAGRLEGVFHFPLPQDASVSGFGIWIGDRISRSRCGGKATGSRNFRNDSSREARSGLLEWTSGNLFSARVFPIGTAFRKASEDRLHASFAAAGEQISLRMDYEARCYAPNHCASCRLT